MMMLSLDHRSHVPLHVQAEHQLRELIKKPEYQKGELLPDEISLARQMAISRTTMRMVIARLTQEGLLERRAGVGTRVCNKPTQSGITEWGSFTREMEKKGIHVQNFSLKVSQVAATEDVASALRVSLGASVLRVVRLRGWDGQPVLLSESYLHPRLNLTCKEDFNHPIYEVIAAASGVVAEVASEELTAVVADASLARQLKVDRGTPLLLRKRAVTDASGRPIEYAVVYYRSDRFILTMGLRKERS